MGIKSYFIEQKTQRNLKKEQQSSKKKLVKINKIALIVDENSVFKYEDFKKLQKEMGLDDSHFEVLTIKSKKSDYNEFKGYVLRRNEVGVMGGIQTETFNHFKSKNYDLLIDFIYPQTLFSKLVVSQIEAPIKVGNAKSEHEYYKILLELDPKEINLSIKEMVKYLKILKVL